MWATSVPQICAYRQRVKWQHYSATQSSTVTYSNIIRLTGQLHHPTRTLQIAELQSLIVQLYTFIKEFFPVLPFKSTY